MTGWTQRIGTYWANPNAADTVDRIKRIFFTRNGPQTRQQPQQQGQHQFRQDDLPTYSDADIWSVSSSPNSLRESVSGGVPSAPTEPDTPFEIDTPITPLTTLPDTTEIIPQTPPLCDAPMIMSPLTAPSAPKQYDSITSFPEPPNSSYSDRLTAPPTTIELMDRVRTKLMYTLTGMKELEERIGKERRLADFRTRMDEVREMPQGSERTAEFQKLLNEVNSDEWIRKRFFKRL